MPVAGRWVNKGRLITPAVAIETRQAELTRERYGIFKPGLATDLDLVFETPAAEVRSLSSDGRAHGLPHRVDRSVAQVVFPSSGSIGFADSGGARSEAVRG